MDAQSTGIDLGLPAPAYGDPTGETAVRNLMRDIEHAPRTDWRLSGPRKVVDGDEPELSRHLVTVLLEPAVVIAFLRFLNEHGEVNESRSGKSYRARLTKKAPGMSWNSSEGNNRSTNCEEGERSNV